MKKVADVGNRRNQDDEQPDPPRREEPVRAELAHRQQREDDEDDRQEPERVPKLGLGDGLEHQLLHGALGPEKSHDDDRQTNGEHRAVRKQARRREIPEAEGRHSGHFGGDTVTLDVVMVGDGNQHRDGSKRGGREPRQLQETTQAAGHRDQEEVAKEKARAAAKELGQTVITEDTGLYLEAYENFPGTYSKFVFLGVGLNGILKLLEDKPRNAHFETIVGYCEPGNEPMVFVGICKGEITEEVHQPITHGVPYDSIFIPEGESRTFSEMTKEEKAKYSHRAKAINKFAEWFNARSNQGSEDSGENSDST